MAPVALADGVEGIDEIDDAGKVRPLRDLQFYFVRLVIGHADICKKTLMHNVNRTLRIL